MNGIDEISQRRKVIWPVVFEEFRIWMDSQRTEHMPDTMEVAVMKWQQDVGMKALTRAKNGDK